MNATWTLVGGTVLGFVLSFFSTLLRDKAHDRHSKKLLAGALATELRAFHEICPRDQGEVIPWAVEPSHLSVYDSAGERLFLLGRELMSDVVKCYFVVKRTLGELQTAQHMTTEVRALLWQAHEGGKRADSSATSARAQAVSRAREALKAVDELLPRLEKVAGASPCPTRKGK